MFLLFRFVYFFIIRSPNVVQNLFNGDGCIGGGQGQGPQPEQGGITSIQQAPQMATGCFSPYYESPNWYFPFYQGG